MAQNLSIIICITLLCLLIHSHSKNDDSFLHRPKVTVSIVNNLSNASQTVTVHCKSRDDDLGTRAVGANEAYAWSFQVNLFDSTLFFCRFVYRGAAVSFDIYKSQRDSYGQCVRNCVWRARDDAVYGYTEAGLNDWILDWPEAV